MDRQWTKYLALPAEITPFEQRFLARLNKVALVFFYLHIPVLMAAAWAAGTGPLNALAFSLVVMTGWKSDPRRRVILKPSCSNLNSERSFFLIRAMSSLISFKSKVLRWLRLERGGC